MKKGLQKTIILPLLLAFVTMPGVPLMRAATTTPSTQPPSVDSNAKVSWPVNEVLKMSEAEVDEDVILAYIDSFQNPFRLSASDILYLKDEGISSNVITRMLRHDAQLSAGEKRPNAPASNTPTSNLQTPADNTTQYVYDQQNPADQSTAVSSQPAYKENPPEQVRYFYQDLAPYGSWIYLENYGWCWQPDVVATNPDWRPYLDDGRWVYSDAGWYWNSDYPWGWAPFHYGRWWDAPCGWVWFPDTIWAPSWVTWRFADPFCGWAPLAPWPFPVFFTPGFHFGFDFGFNLGPGAFAFVGFNHLFFSDLRFHRIPRVQVNNFFNRTTVVNNFAPGSNNVIINRGIPISHVTAVTGRTVQTVHVSNVLVDPKTTRPDRIVRTGSQATVFRPRLTAPTTSDPMVAQQVAPGQRVVRRVPTTPTTTATTSAPQRMAAAPQVAPSPKNVAPVTPSAPTVAPRTVPTPTAPRTRIIEPSQRPSGSPRSQVVPRQMQPSFPPQRHSVVPAVPFQRHAAVSPMPAPSFHSLTPAMPQHAPMTPPHFQGTPGMHFSAPAPSHARSSHGGGSHHRA